MRRIACLLLLLTALAGCGSGQKVGSEKLLDFTPDARGGARLGESTPTPKGTPASLGLGAQRTPTAPPATPAPTPERFFDVALIADSPYYAVSGEPVNEIAMSSALTLRVTNQDATDERPTREFKAKSGLFTSGPLRLNQSWTYRFPPGTTGTIEIEDSFPFAFGKLKLTA